MSDFFVLVETASGYALFHTNGVEEIGSLLPAVQKTVGDYKEFSGMVKLKAFQPFSTAENALENIMNVSENIAHDDLISFLEGNLPDAKKMKKKDQFLGVQVSGLGGAISEKAKIPCQSTAVVLEIIRGIRAHLERFISKLDGGINAQAQLGLSHGYSRAKVKFNVNKQDNMLIQAICLLDQLDKDLNTCAMRVKEWYSWHFPELSKLLPDSFAFARFVSDLGSRVEIMENCDKADFKKTLNEICLDEELGNDIITATKSSMGSDISALDLMNLQQFAKRVVALGQYRHALNNYLSKKVGAVCPNLGALIGEALASRLISHAGSLISLAKCPASTIQILGAEKALFRALKTKGNTPKYGLLFNSGFIGKAKQQNKGRISRYLANKCALAARIDCFSEVDTKGMFGEGLKGQVEERLVFLETGEKPRKNADVMKEIGEKFRDQMEPEESEEAPKSEKKAKKDKKRKLSEDEEEPKKKSKKDKEEKKEKKEKKDKKEKKEKKDKKEKKEKKNKKEKKSKK